MGRIGTFWRHFLWQSSAGIGSTFTAIIGNVQVLLLDLVVIFGLSVVAAILCHRLRIPTSIGLLLAGVLAGPDALALVRSPHDIELLAEVGVVLLLFVVGLEISVADVSRLRREFIIGGSLQFFGTAAVSALALLPMGMNLPQAGYVGCVVALSSTAVVLRMLQERAEIETPHGRAILSTLIYQDIAVVPVMLTAPLLAGLGQASLLPALSGLVLKVVVVAALALLAYRWIVPWVLEHIIRTRSSEAFLLGVFMLCVGIALITQSLGLSLALGAFLAGFILPQLHFVRVAVGALHAGVHAPPFEADREHVATAGVLPGTLQPLLEAVAVDQLHPLLDPPGLLRNALGSELGGEGGWGVHGKGTPTRSMCSRRGAYCKVSQWVTSNR